MIDKLVIEAQKGNKESMMLLITKFQPLLIKYSRLLNYEDAYQELALFFIELIRGIKMDSIRVTNDSTLVMYIKTAVHNQYNSLLRILINGRREINMSSLSIEQQYYIECTNITTYENLLTGLNLSKVLSQSEIMIIYRIYILGYSTNDLAKLQGISRQAMNQKKKRILNKIRKSLDRANGI